MCFGVSQNIIKAHDYYLLAAERGHVMCQFLVAQNLLRGAVDGITENHPEGFKWLIKSAEAGFVEAEALLGYCLLAGKGTEQNLTESMKWTRLAAEKGDAWSQYRLAYLLLRHGELSNEKLMDALKWLIASYNQPDETGGKRHELIMGDYHYIKSQISEQDFASAIELAKNTGPS
jgi:TPR repeat protein